MNYVFQIDIYIYIYIYIFIDCVKYFSAVMVYSYNKNVYVV